MKFTTRTVSTLAAALALIASGLSYWTGTQISMVGTTVGDAREATFKSYRIAQSLKSMAAGYELTMNEFYSTVLEFPAYQAKSAAQKAAIERELAALSHKQARDISTVKELLRLFKEMDTYRKDLESAMTSEEQDWDRAREALFKLNVLSVQAIQQADFLGQSANERANALDVTWQTQQAQSIVWLHITTALTVIVAALLLFGRREPAGVAQPVIHT